MFTHYFINFITSLMKYSHITDISARHFAKLAVIGQSDNEPKVVRGNVWTTYWSILARDSTGVPREGSSFTLPIGEPIGQITVCPWTGTIDYLLLISRGYLQQDSSWLSRGRRCGLALWRVTYGESPLKPAMQIVDPPSTSQMIPSRIPADRKRQKKSLISYPFKKKLR